ncbi:MAG: iron-sulfur cluster biosynthesis transcriptional regulator SufR [Cyanobium sp.]
MSVPPPTGLQSPAPPALRPAGAPEAAGLPAAPQSSTREAALTLLLREGEATAAELATRLGVSVQVMRRHLRSLEEEGLVEACSSHDRPGRPSNRWHLTTRGHEHFPDGSEHFALGLLQSLSSSLPPETLRQLLDGQARDKARLYRTRIGAGALGDQLARLVELRRNEGYVAELLPDPEVPLPPGAEPSRWILREFHCSVMRIAEEFPLVCDQELQLIRHTFPECEIERVHWRLDEGHFCGFRLSRRPEDSAAPC